MSQKLAPAIVPTPGKILSRELEACGWTQKDLAEIIGRYSLKLAPFYVILQIIFTIVSLIFRRQQRFPPMTMIEIPFNS